MTSEISAAKEQIEAIADTLPDTGYIFPPKVSMKIEMTSIAALSTKQIVVESQTPIELVQICSTVKFELVEDKNVTSNANQAVRSVHADPTGSYPMMITYRCQADTTRLEITIRPIEGFYGIGRESKNFNRNYESFLII